MTNETPEQTEARVAKMQADAAAFWAQNTTPTTRKVSPRKAPRRNAQQDYEDTGVRVIGQKYERL